MMPRQYRPTTLEDWQIGDASRLSALLDQAETRQDWVSQSHFAEHNGIGTQSMFWQYKSGRRALNLDAAIGFAAGLGVPVEDISPTLAKRLSLAAPTRDARPVLSRDESRLLDLFRRMDSEHRADTLKYAAYARTISHPVDDRAKPARKRSAPSHHK
jgi:hypothetical protein